LDYFFLGCYQEIWRIPALHYFYPGMFVRSFDNTSFALFEPGMFLRSFENTSFALFFNSSFDGMKITMRQLYTHTDDYRPLLKEIKKSGETRIILVGLKKLFSSLIRGCIFSRVRPFYERAMSDLYP
jgi:hypothetical protein